jgi:hypothetical protein
VEEVRDELGLIVAERCRELGEQAVERMDLR